MNRNELIRIVVLQYGLVGLVAVGAWIIWDAAVAISIALGGLCVAVPTSLFALNLLLSQILRRNIKPVAVLIGEFLKMIAICALFVLVAKFYTGLNWPGMICGIITAECSQFGLLVVKH